MGTEQKEIILGGRHGTANTGNVAIVDAADYEYLNKWKWWVKKTGNSFYAVRCEHYYVDGVRKCKNIKLHRFLLGITDPNVFIDHKDRNALNCTRNNLRIATKGQNNTNRKVRSKSIYKGVYEKKPQYKQIYYYAECQKNGKRYRKHFKSEVEAAIWYNEKAKELHGEFAYINTIN